MNFLTARVTEVGRDGVRVAVAGSNGPATIPVRGHAEAGQELTLGIRPEHIELRKGGEGELALNATIELLEQLGATSFLYCALADGTKLTVQVAGQIEKHPGDRVEVCFPSDKAQLFEKSEEELALDRLDRATPGSDA
jgi:ABC-type sugar transport system ATPase subunit